MLQQRKGSEPPPGVLDGDAVTAFQDDELPKPALWMDVNEMARRLRVSKSTVYRMVKRRTLCPPRHLSRGMTRWLSDDYLKWYGSMRDHPP